MNSLLNQPNLTLTKNYGNIETLYQKYMRALNRTKLLDFSFNFQFGFFNKESTFINLFQNAVHI